MKKPLPILPLLFLLLISYGIACFFWLYKHALSFSIIEHSFHPSFFSLLLITGGVFFHLIVTLKLLAKIESKSLKTEYSSQIREGLTAFLPLSLFLLSPILLKFYLTAEDLKIRLNFMLFFVILGIIFLKFIQINRHKNLGILLDRAAAKFTSLSTRKKLLMLFLIAMVIYNTATYLIVSKGYAYTGDEPYYLLTAHSLYQDQDINVANNYKNKDYFYFYPREIYPNLKLKAYARFGKKGGDYLYPVNQPGISVLIQPFYWISQQFSGKFRIFILKGSLSIWAVLIGLQLYLFMQQTWKNEKISLLLWFLYSFSAPVLFYATHLYPEIPIALFSLYIFRKVRSDKKITLAQYFFMGFLFSLFFWFGLKYNMIFWPLILVSGYFLIKEHKAGKKMLALLLFPFFSMLLYYLYIYELYGTFNPIAIYEGVLSPDSVKNFKELMIKLPIMLRIDSFLDYFLDQRDGLLLYSPIYFFTFLGFFAIFFHLCL